MTTATVAVLGAGGFIGNRTLEMLYLGGRHVVRPVVRRPQALALASRFDIDGRIADARDETALTAAFAGCNYVVHAIAGDPRTIVESIVPVYRAASAAGVQRLVYLSSASVHGQAPSPGTDEESALSDRQPLAYNNAKVEAERRLQDLRRGGDVEVVRLRPGIVHGPRSQWTGGFADELLDGTAYLVGRGRGICNACYVDNAVQAIILAMETPTADGNAYIVGDAEIVTWADLCRPIAEALKRDLEDVFVGAPVRSVRDRICDSELYRSSVARLPGRVRRALRAALSELRRSDPAGVTKRGPVVTAERVALHTCQVRLPIDRARREIGYDPIVPFQEACRRAVAWLAFAGYPVTDEARGATSRETQTVLHSEVAQP
jgi:nucleoside-diphosphate-sugar epimerase